MINDDADDNNDDNDDDNDDDDEDDAKNNSYILAQHNVYKRLAKRTCQMPEDRYSVPLMIVKVLNNGKDGMCIHHYLHVNSGYVCSEPRDPI